MLICLAQIFITAPASAIRDLDSVAPATARTNLGLGTGNSPQFTGLTLTGVGALSAGTALLPSLIPSGDTNTGMWFPAADTIAWSTAGSERMRILSTGEVGIGTSTPGSFGKLEVLGSGYTGFSVASSDASGVRVVLAANAASEARINVTSNHPLATFVNGAERMRVTAAGNVGIGTTSPGHLLQVNSTGSTISATTSSTTTQFTGPGLRLYNTNASMSTQAGLGIASLISDVSATQGYMAFFQTNNSGGFVRDILRYDYNASLWQFYTNATEKLRITSAGNVGIGTTAPDALLSVNGIASFGAGAVATPSIAAFGDLNTGMWFPAADTIAWSTNGTERLRIASGGTVSTTGTLTIAGGAASISSTSFDFTSSTTFFPQIILVNTANDTFGPYWNTRKLRGAAAANSGDSLGTFVFQSADTGGTVRNAAFFSVVSEGAGATFHSAYYSFTLINTAGTFVIPLQIKDQGLLVTDGTALLPSFTFSADPDTGFWRPAANTLAASTGGSERLRITSGGNLGLGTSTFGTSAAVTLAIATGTAPTTGPADTIQIYSTDLSAGNTMLSLYTEGTVVNTNTVAATTHRIAIRVNGTVYYLLANTAA